MAEQEQEQEEEDMSLRAVVHDNPHQPSVYANMCGVLFGPDEVMLQFAQRDTVKMNEGVSVVKVYTSFPHIKRLAAILVHSIQEHERNFGEIPTDPSERLTPEGKKTLEEHIQKNAT